MSGTSKGNTRLRRVAAIVAALAATLTIGVLLISQADGPFFVFAGGPLRSGELVDLEAVGWDALDSLHELELEIVGAATSRTLWFSAFEGAAYVACDLDCIGGRLTRWPQQIERDDRVVIRIEGKRALARLIHVPHGSAEYQNARAARERKYSGGGGGRAAAETAAHGAVVSFGEELTGRSQREEPGDRMYRVGPR